MFNFENVKNVSGLTVYAHFCYKATDFLGNNSIVFVTKSIHFDDKEEGRKLQDSQQKNKKH